MSRDQEHRAINNALLALGNGLAKEPIQRGFKNNLGVIGRAMNPALSAYNTSGIQLLPKMSVWLIKYCSNKELSRL